MAGYFGGGSSSSSGTGTTYTPTIVAGGNVFSIGAASRAQYTQVGSTVTVFLTVAGIVPILATTLSTFTVTLPVATANSNTGVGVATLQDTDATSDVYVAGIVKQTATTTVTVSFSVISGGDTFAAYITFAYQVT